MWRILVKSIDRCVEYKISEDGLELRENGEPIKLSKDFAIILSRRIQAYYGMVLCQLP